DGIRDGHVTGVQTCALPICYDMLGLTDNPPPFAKYYAKLSDQIVSAASAYIEDVRNASEARGRQPEASREAQGRQPKASKVGRRSEERRVGKECRARGSP